MWKKINKKRIQHTETYGSSKTKQIAITDFDKRQQHVRHHTMTAQVVADSQREVTERF